MGKGGRPGETITGQQASSGAGATSVPLGRIARQAAFRAGLTAESRAAAYLASHGYAVAARRFKSRVGEVDIVARRDRELLFVEVKARRRLDDAALSVTPRQQKRIVAAAEAWLADHPDDGTCNIRFDVILVARNGTRHIAAAFDATG
ncbi:MAG TPA: YraN family protein [Xanthobacteraceae bacterium]|nr:YraN family protein [Xanthobacteraceae bacterium]